MQILAVFIFCYPHSDISLQVTTRIRSLSPLAADKLSDFSWWLGSTLADRSLFNFAGISTAIFAGKPVEDAITHVEDFRKAIESTPFVVRGRERRRNSANKRGKKSGFSRKQVKVTVSIGLASPVGQVTNPEKVIKAADKKLYKAKKTGRNRTAY